MHKDELYKLSDDKLKESGLYVCRQCGDYVAASESVFLRHITSKHVKTRKTTNHKIVTNLLYSIVEPFTQTIGMKDWHGSTLSPQKNPTFDDP